jgi:uncharacterized protein with HEPN domain
MAGLRDILVHQYDRIPLELIWSAIQKDLPELKAEIIKALPPLDELEEELGS